jgi:hypothetical protein
MRWKQPSPPRPGSTRVVTKFLIRHKTLDRETRWLERSSYVQVRAARDNDRMAPWVWRDWKWAEHAAEAKVAGETPPDSWLPRPDYVDDEVLASKVTDTGLYP